MKSFKLGVPNPLLIKTIRRLLIAPNIYIVAYYPFLLFRLDSIKNYVNYQMQ